MYITITASPNKFVYITDDIRLIPNATATVDLDAMSVDTLELIQSSHQLKNISLTTYDSVQLDAKIVQIKAGAVGLIDQPNGLPQLDDSRVIRSQYLPSYIDDVVTYASRLDFPLVGMPDRIYVETTSNLAYRYSDSSYYVLGKGGNSDDLIQGTVNRFYTPSVEAGLVKTVNGMSGAVTAATVAQGAKADTAVQPGQLAAVATSGSYINLTNKPTIPTDTAQLTNGAGFITSAIDKVLTGLSLSSLASVVSTDTVVVAIGKLQAGKQALSAALTQISATTPAESGVLQYKSGSWVARTVAQLKTDLGLATVANSGSYNDLLNKPTIPSNSDGLPEGVTNLYYTATRVRSVVLTGLSFATATAIAATDGLVIALGKLQAQLNNIVLDISNINLRGQDLVSNGLGQLKNNKYFSTFTFDPLDRPAGAGSFTCPVATSAVGDELIPVDPTRYYKLSYFIRQKTAGVVANAYGYISPFDADGYQIYPSSYMARPNTLTTLAADLKPGDTVMQLTSAANWITNAGTNTHERSAIFWNYVDLSGYAWPANTYSRNWSGADLYSDGGITGNTVTLRVPWAGITTPAGTKLSNGTSGASYMYIGIRGTTTPEAWTNYNGIFGTTHQSATLNAASTQLPISTAYIRVGFLFNRNPVTSGYTTGSQTGVAGVSIRDWSAAYDPSLLKNTVLQTVDASPTKLVTTNTNGDIKSINITVDANGFIKKV